MNHRIDYKYTINVWKIATYILTFCILWSPIVGFYDVIDAFSGIYHALTVGTSTITRVIRDVAILILYVYFFIMIFLSERVNLNKKIETLLVFNLISLTAITIIISVYYSYIFLNIDLKAIILGLKSFLYMPLIIIAWILLKKYPESSSLLRKSILFVLIIQLIVGAIQIRYMPPLAGKTFLGSLPLGTFSHYTIYGAFLCVMVFTHFFVRNFSLPKPLLIATMLMILVCGARSAVVVLAFLIFMHFIDNYVKSASGRIALFAAIPVFFLALSLILPTLSGREGTKVGLEKDPRWEKINNYFSGKYTGGALDTGQLAFGSGVGLASNAVTAYFGPGKFQGQFICEPMHLSIIAQYGFVGLAILYLTMVSLFCLLYGRTGLILSMMLAMIGIGVNILEVYPANMLIPVVLAFHTRGSLPDG